MPQGANIAGGAIAGAGAGFQVGGPYGAIAGAIIGGALGAAEKTPTLQLQHLDLANPSEGQNEFLQQGAHIGDVSKTLAGANAIDNSSFQKDASEFAPNLMGNIKQNAANTSANLAGNLSTGVQAATGKPGATARDLGLTSDQLMQQGAANLGNETKAATSLNPFNETATDTLLSPAALLKRNDQMNSYNVGVENQKQGAVFANAASNDWARQAMGMLTSISPTGGLAKGVSGNQSPGAGYNYQSPGGSSGGGGDYGGDSTYFSGIDNTNYGGFIPSDNTYFSGIDTSGYP